MHIGTTEDCAQCIRKYLGLPYQNSPSNIGRRDDALLEVLARRYQGKPPILKALELIRQETLRSPAP